MIGPLIHFLIDSLKERLGLRYEMNQ